MRRRWTPAFAAFYGIRPWEMDDLTTRELSMIFSDLQQRDDGPVA